MSLIDQFVEYASSPCYATPEQYLWWCGAGLLSAAMGRGYWTFLRGGDDRADRLYPNLFIVLLGIPGTGKSVPIDEAKRFSSKIGIKLTSDSFTTQGLVLEAKSMDEAVFRSMPRSFSSLLDEQSPQAIKTLLCDGYDCTNHYSRSTGGRGEEIIVNICHSLLTACTPSHLNACFKRNDWQEGLPSRFVYVWGERVINRREERPRNRELETVLSDGLQAINELGMLGSSLGWTDKAKEARKAWVKEAQDSMPVHMNVEGYWSRREVTLAKTSMIIAVSNFHKNISLDDWEQAVKQLTETEKTISIALGATSTNPYYLPTQWLVRWLANQKRSVPESEIRRHMTWNFHPRDIETVLEDLIKREVICIEPNPNPTEPRRFFFKPPRIKAIDSIRLTPLQNTSIQKLTPEAMYVPM